MDLLGGVGQLAGVGHGDARQLAARPGLAVVAHAADRERAARLVALDSGHDDGRCLVAFVQPCQRRDVADIGLLDRQGVLVELVAAHQRHRHRTARGVEAAPGVAPRRALVERLDAGLALPQGNHQRRPRHGLGDRDTALAQPGIHRLGAEHHVQRADIAVGRAALVGELDTADHAVDPRRIERRHLCAILRRHHALDQELYRFLLGLTDGLLARLDGVGPGRVDIDAADRVGVAACHLRRSSARRHCQQHDKEREKPAG